MSDILELLKPLKAEWSTVTAHAEAFGAIAAIALLVAWTAAWIILKQRLVHHRELIDHYKDILADKAPGLVASNRVLTPRFGGLRFFLFGILLIALGYAAAILLKSSVSPGMTKFSRVQLTNIGLRDGQDPVRFDLYLQNAGTIAASGLVHKAAGATLDHEATSSELDSVFDLKKQVDPAEPAESEIQPSQIVWYTFPLVVNKVDYETVMHGPKYLYLFAHESHKNSELSADQKNITEICLFTFAGQAMHQCSRHNRIYLE